MARPRKNTVKNITEQAASVEGNGYVDLARMIDNAQRKISERTATVEDVQSALGALEYLQGQIPTTREQLDIVHWAMTSRASNGGRGRRTTEEPQEEENVA